MNNSITWQVGMTTDSSLLHIHPQKRELLSIKLKIKANFTSTKLIAHTTIHILLCQNSHEIYETAGDKHLRENHFLPA
jgi:ribosomal protein L31